MNDTFPTRMEADPQRAWLEQFSPQRRSTVANIVLSAIRAGKTDLQEVRLHVGRDARRRLDTRWYDPEEREANHHFARQLLEAARDDVERLAAYVEHCVEWESLPDEERDRIKTERWMSQQEPTPKQLDYLTMLGYSGPAPESKLTACRLIDRLKGGDR